VEFARPAHPTATPLVYDWLVTDHVDERDVDEDACGESEDPGGRGPVDAGQQDAGTHAAVREHRRHHVVGESSPRSHARPQQHSEVTCTAQQSDLRYDTTGACAQKLTRVTLIYRTEPRTEIGKREKTKK